MNAQQRHYGIEIAAGEQPRCPICNGYMMLDIMYPRDECVAGWYCMTPACDGNVPCEDWLATGQISDRVRDHFEALLLPASELQTQWLLDAGWTRVGGYIWGGGFWGVADGLAFHTGWRGEVEEYWAPPAGIRSN